MENNGPCDAAKAISDIVCGAVVSSVVTAVSEALNVSRNQAGHNVTVQATAPQLYRQNPEPLPRPSPRPLPPNAVQGRLSLTPAASTSDQSWLAIIYVNRNKDYI